MNISFPYPLTGIYSPSFPQLYLWGTRASQVAMVVKHTLPQQCRRLKRCGVRSSSWEDPLEVGMAPYSSVLAWTIHVDRDAWRARVHGIAIRHDWPHIGRVPSVSNSNSSRKIVPLEIMLGFCLLDPLLGGKQTTQSSLSALKNLVQKAAEVNVLRLCRIPADVFICYLSSLEACKPSVSTECEVPGAWLSQLRWGPLHICSWSLEVWILTLISKTANNIFTYSLCSEKPLP